MLTLRETKRIIGNVILLMRMGADLTQEDIASEMQVGRSTVVRWENGEGEMVKQLLAWKRYCETTRKDPVRATLAIMYPEMYSKNKEDTLDNKRTKLDYYLHNLASDDIVESIDFVFNGNHGSIPEAVVQEWVANLHTPLKDRHNIATMISNNFKFAKQNGSMTCPDDVMPDIEMLDHAANAGFEAAINGKEAYVVNNVK